MANIEWIVIVKIIIIPPNKVSTLGFSLITSHTQIGPSITSNKKKRLTSAAVINLGAIVTRTKGMATHKIHITGTIIISLFKRSKLLTKINAKSAVPSLPNTAAGTRSLLFAYLAKFALIAKPKAVRKPNISPIIFPNWRES